jgi:single-strand DNA-binding protein
MANFNKVMLMGNLTRDVEIRAVREGSSVGKFALAVNRNYTLASGEKREEVAFIECEAWGKTAEIIAKYCTKGRPLFVEGRLKQDSWTDKDNNKRTMLKVVVENFQFVGGRESGAPAGNSYSGDGADSGGPAPRGNWSKGNSQGNNNNNSYNEPEPQPSAGDDIPF